MLARIAQELFWLGRDLARAEHTARMLDGAFHADVSGGTGQRGIALSWEGVLAIIGAKAPAPPGKAATAGVYEVTGLVDGAADPEAASGPPGGEGSANGADGSPEAEALALLSSLPAGIELRVAVSSLLTLDTDSPASIVSCIDRARERGRGLRDVVSTEMWQALNSFYLSLGRYDLPAALQTGPYSVYQDVKERCALFWGLLDRTMLRDEGRSFLEAGGRIEEADMVLRMLRVTVPDEPPPTRIEGEVEGEGEALALLHAVGGFQAYRRATRTEPSVHSVVRFLLYDGSYPGSVASSVEALRGALSTADAQPRSSPPVLRLGRLIADLELQRRTPETRNTMHETLAEVQDELELIDHDIDDRYFAIAALAAVHL